MWNANQGSGIRTLPMTKLRCANVRCGTWEPLIRDEPFRRRHPFPPAYLSGRIFGHKETSWLMNGQHSATRFVQIFLYFGPRSPSKYLSNEQSKKRAKPFIFWFQPRASTERIHHMQIVEKAATYCSRPLATHGAVKLSLQLLATLNPSLNPTCFCTRYAFFTVWNWMVKLKLRHQCETSRTFNEDDLPYTGMDSRREINAICTNIGHTLKQNNN